MDLAFISTPDMMVVMVVALLLFGPKGLPEVGRQLGTLMRDMRKMMGQFTDAMDEVQSEFKPPVTTTQPVFNKPVSTIPEEDLMKPYDQRESYLLTQRAEPLSLSTLPPLQSDAVEQEEASEEPLKVDH